MVVYTTYETAVVTPDGALVKRLKIAERSIPAGPGVSPVAFFLRM